jgi:teichuronic acid biosynthesis glycosyltransferase TuaC
VKVLFVTPYFPTIERPYVSPFIERLYYGLKQEVDVDLYHFEAKRKLSNYLKARKEIKQLLKTNTYDIVHINWGQTISVIPFFIQSKIVVSFRGSDVYGVLTSQGKHNYISKLVQMVSSFASFRSSANIYVSHQIKSFFKASKPSKVIPSGIDIQYKPKKSKVVLRTKLGIKESEIIILFVGNTKNVGKRYFMAEQLVNALKEKNHNIRLVQVWGKTPKEVFEHMTAADFLLQTSQQEGSPNVVKEALACNLSIISTPVGDTTERIGHLNTCYLSQDLSYNSVLAAANTALEEFTQNRENDFSNEIHKFSLEQEIAQVQEVYRKVLLD